MASASTAASKVWYTSYGSNMSRERFMCYLKGGAIPSMTKPCAGSRDPTEPEASEVLRIRGVMPHTARSSKTWGGGGVLFIHAPEPDEVAVVPPGTDAPGAGETLARAYLITLEQFCDVLAQESAKKPGALGVEWAEAQLGKLRAKGAGSSSRWIKHGWYGRAMYLGDLKGYPCVTFTCEPHEATDPSLHSPPSPAYANVVLHGLKQCGVPGDVATSYVEQFGTPVGLAE
jgi:hypothetical protein